MKKFQISNNKFQLNIQMTRSFKEFDVPIFNKNILRLISALGVYLGICLGLVSLFQIFSSNGSVSGYELRSYVNTYLLGGAITSSSLIIYFFIFIKQGNLKKASLKDYLVMTPGLLFAASWVFLIVTL